MPPIEKNRFADSPKSSIQFPALSFLAATGALKGTDATSCVQSLSIMNINIEFLVLSFEGKGFVSKDIVLIFLTTISPIITMVALRAKMTNAVYPTSFLPYQVGKQRPPRPWSKPSIEVPFHHHPRTTSSNFIPTSTSLPTPAYDAYLPTVLIAEIDELTIVAHVNDVDFICLAESWLSQAIPDSTLSSSNLYRI